MKRKNKKKSYKTTLLVLLLTAILLIASTYAWFTSNRTVTVDTIEVNVAAVNGLQISTNASDWSAFIDANDITSNAYSGAVNRLPATLYPVSTAKGLNSDGTMKMFLGNVETDQTANSPTYGEYLLTTTATDDSVEAPSYLVFDMFLRLDGATSQTIYLTPNAGVEGRTAGKGIENASRVAFVKEGYTADVAAVSTITAAKTTDSSNVIIWEPNNNAHTTASIAHASSVYGATINATTVVPNYYGVNSAFSNAALTDTSSSKFTQITPDIKTGTTMASTQFITLEPGITKFRVYMWIEGQDYDCQNSASGSNMALNLQFSLDNN